MIKWSVFRSRAGLVIDIGPIQNSHNDSSDWIWYENHSNIEITWTLTTRNQNLDKKAIQTTFSLL